MDQWILSRFGPEDLQRMRMMAQSLSLFRNYQDFLDTQTQVINQFNEGSLTTAELFRAAIPMITLLDKEFMNPWEASGFFFTNDGQIVFFHER